MSSAVFIIIGIITVIILAEIISRLAYRLYFHLPFQDRRIAEYLYSRFLVETDPPVHCIFKKGFRSSEININRFGLRGDEPAPNGARRRILVVGESNFFGAKLQNERHTWSNQLQRLLTTIGHADWEVINGGTPLYGSAQHWHFWAGALAEVRPEIMIVQIGDNDVAQMTLLGERWHPNAHWPFEFLLKLEKKGTRLNSLLGRFCLYFFLRRFFEKESAPRFPKGDGELLWEECKRHTLDQYRKFHSYAMQNGIRIVFVGPPLLCDLDLTKKNKRRLYAIQRNYQNSLKSEGPYFFDLKDSIAQELCPELDVPYWNLIADLQADPHCFSFWYDMAHWNEKGMSFVARKLYERIEKLGWWV